MSNGSDPITSLGQMLMVAGMNHGTSWAIVKAIDYLASLSDDDLKDMSKNISPDYAQKLYAVARAARSVEKKEVTVEPA